MNWSIVLAKERVIEINSDDINEAMEKAKVELKEGERIVSIKIKR